MSNGDLIHIVSYQEITERRRRIGRFIIRGSFAVLLFVLGLQVGQVAGLWDLGFQNFQPTAFAWVLWCVCLCVGQVLIRGEQGKRILFVLPTALFVISLTIIPLLLGVGIAFTDWNLSSFEGPKFAGLGNIERMLSDDFYWNALRNMVFYTALVFVEYIVAFGLALVAATERHPEMRAPGVSQVRQAVEVGITMVFAAVMVVGAWAVILGDGSSL